MPYELTLVLSSQTCIYHETCIFHALFPDNSLEPNPEHPVLKPNTSQREL